MKLTEKLRQYWHDIYYSSVSEKGVRFALTCKDVAEQVDMGASKIGNGRLRFLLHLSLCQGCKNYLSITRALGQAIKDFLLKNEKTAHLEQLNNELLRKHSRENHKKNS